MKIYAPVKDFDGLRNNVRFVRGVGETEDQQLAEWFLSRGYTVEKCDNPHTNIEECVSNLVIEVENDEIETPNDEVEPDFENMTPNDLRDWMREHGYGSKIKNTRSKEKLLEILRG